MRAVWAHKLIAIELEATLGVIAATWILAMLMIHRTKVVPRGIDRLIRFPRANARVARWLPGSTHVEGQLDERDPWAGRAESDGRRGRCRDRSRLFDIDATERRHGRDPVHRRCNAIRARRSDSVRHRPPDRVATIAR
jgi:hypothetical protein